MTVILIYIVVMLFSLNIILCIENNEDWYFPIIFLFIGIPMLIVMIIKSLIDRLTKNKIKNSKAFEEVYEAYLTGFILYVLNIEYKPNSSNNQVNRMNWWILTHTSKQLAEKKSEYKKLKEKGTLM